MPSSVQLLRPYFDGSTPPEGMSEEEAEVSFGYWFVDAPPALVLRVLHRFGHPWVRMRGNGQPPNVWLVREAAKRGGLVGGHLADGGRRRRIRVDTVSLDRQEVEGFIEAVRSEFPTPWLATRPDSPTALELALVSTFAAWDAEETLWEGSADEYLTQQPEGAVVSFWWD